MEILEMEVMVEGVGGIEALVQMKVGGEIRGVRMKTV